MTDHIEVELKLQFIDPGLWGLVFALPVIQQWGDQQSYRRERLEAQYFDTQGQHLQKARLAYRIRYERGQWLATVKGDGASSGGLHQRKEWTVAVAEPIPSLEPFMDMPVGEMLREAVRDEALTVLYTTCFERQAMLLHMPDGSSVELAADQGEIRVGDSQAPILELELELISGNPAVLLQLGATMAKEFPLLPEWRSKYFRALLLAGLADDHEPTEQVDPIAEGEKSGVVLAKLLVFKLQSVLTAQENFLRVPADPVALHHLYLQLCKLRAILSISHPLMSNETYSALQASLKHWENLLGAVREFDVVLAAWHEMLAGGTVQLEVSPILADKLAAKRIELVGQLYQNLAKGSTTPVLLELWAWLAEYGQQAASKEEAVTIEDFSRQRLVEWAQQIVSVGKKLDIDNVEAIHNVYISGIKICYVLENLLPVWPGKAQRMIERFKALQDGLGYLHDVYISQRITQGLLRTQSSRLMYRDTGLLAGWQAHQVLGARRKITKQWRRVWRTAEALIKKQAQDRGPGIGNRSWGSRTNELGNKA